MVKKNSFFFVKNSLYDEDDKLKQTMNVRFGDGGMLKRLVDGVKDLVPEVLMSIKAEEGIKWQEMDSSHVSLVSAQLNPKAFSEFHAPTPLTIGINMSALSKILRCGSKSDDVSWKLDDETRDSLEIMTDPPSKEGGGGAKRGRSGKFSLKLMQIDREAFAVPETEYAADIFVRSSALQRVVKDLIPFAEEVVITVTHDFIRFAVDGDYGKGEITLGNSRHPKTTNVVSFDCFQQQQHLSDFEDSAVIFLRSSNEKEIIQLKFAMKFLAYFATCTSLSPHIQISMEKESPIRLQYPLYGTTPVVSVAPSAAATNNAEEKKSGTKRKKTTANDDEGKSTATATTTTTKKSMSGSKEPGTQDIVGLLAFFLAPKLDDTPIPTAEDTKTEEKQEDGDAGAGAS